MSDYQFECCDFSDADHLTALAELIQVYMSDPMGGHEPHGKLQQLRLVDGLANHPSALLLFVKAQEVYAGMAVCFVNFSTFQVKPYFYVHDLIVRPEFRGQGLGRALLDELVRLSQEKEYCKLTLEVREDNAVAQKLYRSLGFAETEPRMLFWTKTL